MVEQWEDVDEDRGAVDADFQPSIHQAQHAAELLVIVIEAVPEDQGADDVRHGVADDWSRVDTGAAGLLLQSQKLGFDVGKAVHDAQLQAQPPQAKVPECAEAEPAMLLPQRAIRCKYYSWNLNKSQKKIISGPRTVGDVITRTTILGFHYFQ